MVRNVMSKLDDFVDFARRLPARDMRIVEAQLELIMKDHDNSQHLSEEQEALVIGILSDTTRAFADKSRIEKIFGRKV